MEKRRNNYLLVRVCKYLKSEQLNTQCVDYSARTMFCNVMRIRSCFTFTSPLSSAGPLAGPLPAQGRCINISDEYASVKQYVMGIVSIMSRYVNCKIFAKSTSVAKYGRDSTYSQN